MFTWMYAGDLLDHFPRNVVDLLALLSSFALLALHEFALVVPQVPVTLRVPNGGDGGGAVPRGGLQLERAQRVLAPACPNSMRWGLRGAGLLVCSAPAKPPA